MYYHIYNRGARGLSIFHELENFGALSELKLDFAGLARETLFGDEEDARRTSRGPCPGRGWGSGRYALCQESPMVKVRPDRPYRGAPTDTLRLYAARREYEPAQVVVAAFGDSLKAVRAEVSDLVGPGRIGRENIDLRLVEFVRVRKPSAGSYEGPGLYVLEDAPAGEYGGRLAVRPEGSK